MHNSSTPQSNRGTCHPGNHVCSASNQQRTAFQHLLTYRNFVRAPRSTQWCIPVPNPRQHAILILTGGQSVHTKAAASWAPPTTWPEPVAPTGGPPQQHGLMLTHTAPAGHCPRSTLSCGNLHRQPTACRVSTATTSYTLHLLRTPALCPGARHRIAVPCKRIDVHLWTL